MTRKRTKFQTCTNHDWLNSLPRYRRAEFFTEGGPANTKGCAGGKCRLWPGTDLFEPTVCNAEMTLDWAVNPNEAREEYIRESMPIGWPRPVRAGTDA